MGNQRQPTVTNLPSPDFRWRLVVILAGLEARHLESTGIPGDGICSQDLFPQGCKVRLILIWCNIFHFSHYKIHIPFIFHSYFIFHSSKEVWKSNFRQYGEMKKQSAGRRVRREKVGRKKMQVREKVGKLRNTVFSCFVAPEGWKVGSLKRRVRRHLGRWEMKSCTPLWREAHLWSQNVKNTRGSDHFWKLRCRKSARRCGAKHILKSKCAKHTRFGPLLEVAMSKKCTPLWREAHLEVKMYKAHQLRTTFGSWDVEKVHAVVARSTFPSQNVQNTPASDTFGGSDVEKMDAVVARSTFPSQNVQSTTCSRHFWRFGCRKSVRRCGAKHISKNKCTKHHMFAPLLEVRMSKKCVPLWREGHFEVKMYKTLGVRTTFGGSDVGSLRFGSLHYTIHSTTLQYITLHSTTLQLQLQNYTTTLHYTPLH